MKLQYTHWRWAGTQEPLNFSTTRLLSTTLRLPAHHLLPRLPVALSPRSRAALPTMSPASTHDTGGTPDAPPSPTNPFTRNQDAAKLARRLRRISVQSGASNNVFHDDQSDGESESDVLPVPPSNPPEGQGQWFDSFHRGSGRQSHGEKDLQFRPRLQPAGGDLVNEPVPGQLADPNVVYGHPDPQHRRVSGPVPYNRQRGIVRTYSLSQSRPPLERNNDTIMRARRLSHDPHAPAPRRFIVDVDDTMQRLLDQEDSDGNYQISITDVGPKVMQLGTEESEGYNTFEIRGTYMLSNLLQELALAQEHGRKRIVLDEARLTENPVDRLSRMISQSFWHNLTRRIDGESIEAIIKDPKNRSKSNANRIYVPAADKAQVEYYRRVAKEKPAIDLEVIELPHMSEVTSELVRDYNEAPGLLALAMEEVEDPANPGQKTLRGKPFVVPGARFNELYGWDSYFITLGLVVDNYIDLPKSIVDNFIYEIEHYAKILNGARTYYLLRSHPPFLTDMALQVYCRLDPQEAEENKLWLKKAIQAAIKEYHTVWMSQPRYDPKTGLSRYHAGGIGVPPETEASHFIHILRPYAERQGISINEYVHYLVHFGLETDNCEGIRASTTMAKLRSLSWMNTSGTTGRCGRAATTLRTAWKSDAQISRRLTCKLCSTSMR